MRVSMKEVRRLTWSLFWRQALVAVIGAPILGFAAGFVVGFAFAWLGLAKYTIVGATIAGYVAGLLVSFFALNWALTKVIGAQIDGKSLALQDAAGA